jgi:hypothetical protein
VARELRLYKLSGVVGDWRLAGGCRCGSTTVVELGFMLLEEGGERASTIEAFGSGGGSAVGGRMSVWLDGGGGAMGRAKDELGIMREVEDKWS